MAPLQKAVKLYHDKTCDPLESGHDRQNIETKKLKREMDEIPHSSPLEICFNQKIKKAPTDTTGEHRQTPVRFGITHAGISMSIGIPTVQFKKGEDAPAVPTLHGECLDSEASELPLDRADSTSKGSIAQNDLDVDSGQWRKVVLVNGNLEARTRRNPSRRYREKGYFVVPQEKAFGVEARQRKFPLGDQAPATIPPDEPIVVPGHLSAEVKQNLKNWEDCFATNAIHRLQGARKRLDKDDEQRIAGNHMHRRRAVPGNSSAEVRIGLNEYHPTVVKVIRAGFTLELPKKSPPKICAVVPLQRRDWGFDAERLMQDGMSIDWRDKELLFYLKWGFYDYSPDTPPICSFSPHQKKIWEAGGEFEEAIQESWIGESQDHPPTIPFQVTPGSVERKRDNSWRLVWNASWPALGTHESLVNTSDSGWIPVSSNANTRLPENLQFEWGAIEINNEILEILADGARCAGEKLLGTTLDLKKWFRQLAMSKGERWKTTMHVMGEFRQDKRMQMGRSSSAHSAQRTTLLIAELIERAARSERWGLEEDEWTAAGKRENWSRLQHWRSQRRACFRADPRQDGVLVVTTFQDDITVFVIGEYTARDAAIGIRRLLHERYKLRLSKKEEANMPFSERFSSIGAIYETSDLNNIVCKPRSEKIENFRAGIESMRRKAGRVVPLLYLQTFVGLHHFLSRSVNDGNFRCNFAYRCLRSLPETRSPTGVVGHELIADAEELLCLLQSGDLARITQDPTFLHPGLQGANSDASGSAGTLGKGWGVCVMGYIASGGWNLRVRKALGDGVISLSPLELLTIAFALYVGVESGTIGTNEQIVIRNDNESACNAVNTQRAFSLPMLEALRVGLYRSRSVCAPRCKQISDT